MRVISMHSDLDLKLRLGKVVLLDMYNKADLSSH
jgi:hypothetical protein